MAQGDHSRFQSSSLDATYARIGAQYFGQGGVEENQQVKVGESSLTTGMVTDDTQAVYSSDSTTISVLSSFYSLDIN